MKIASQYKEQGLEAPDSSWRKMPDKHGVIEVPDQLAGYAEKAASNDRFVVLGRQWGGFGPGKLPKPYAQEVQSDQKE